MYLKRLLSTKIRYVISSVRYQSTAYLSNNKEDLIITNNEQNEHFPLVWLRDNCTCESCFHRNSKSRIINWDKFNINPEVKSVEVSNSNVIIKWQDNHISEFKNNWLKERSFLQNAQKNYLENNYCPKKILWDKDSFESLITKFDFNDVFNNNSSLYNWLKNLAQHGVALVENVPKDENQCKQLANRIAFIRRTHYQDLFHVIHTPNTSNVAYLKDFVQFHTDIVYYEYTPGVTLLHYLVQTDNPGGENLLTDGFYVAERLYKEDRHSFNILSSVEISWSDIGAEHGDKYHLIARYPVIKLDSSGKVEKITYSVPHRDSHFNVDPSFVKPWYKAMKVFADALNASAYKIKLKSGTLMAFDNMRLLHGRVGYEDETNNRRHLIGCYIDWDQIFSKMRVLIEEEKQNRN